MLVRTQTAGSFGRAANIPLGAHGRNPAYICSDALKTTLNDT